jgi:tRNA(Ile)-lysidine synthetase-like protein
LFEQAVLEGLGAVARGTVFLAAVSGGADSTAMLTALAALRERGGFLLHCLHVEHGIRDAVESRGDARAVVALCKRLAVPCRVVSVKHGRIAEVARQRGLGIEGAARTFRRRVWNREARRVGAARVLVAHTTDDLLETALMRVLRGVGPAGLAAMPREKGRVLRPLIALARSDVLAYLAERGIPFRTDSTNSDIRYLRNRIRHRLVPCLDTFFPQWRTTLFRMAETQRLIADFFSVELARRVAWQWDGAALWLDERVFFALPLILREEALFEAVDMLADRTVRDHAGTFNSVHEKVSTTKKHESRDSSFFRVPSWLNSDVNAACPDTDTPYSAVPKRANLRRFSEGGTRAMDAGPIRLEMRGKRVVVLSTSACNTNYDEGFALVLREDGVYALDGLNIVLADGALELNGTKKKVQPPLVFRQVKNAQGKGLDRRRSSRYTSSILVEDVQGPLARIIRNNNEVFVYDLRE